MVSRIATIAASAFLTLACASQERSNTEVKAEVRLTGTATGTVTLTQKKYTTNTVFSGSFEKVPPGKHGIRISEGNSAFNPFSKKHGGPWQSERAVGDLGNVEADASGNISWNHSDPYVKLSGPFSVVGKNLTLHEKEDDFGLARNEGSVKDGNVGSAISSGNIVGV